MNVHADVARWEFIALLITEVLLIVVAVQAYGQQFYYSAGSAIACMFLASIPIVLRRKKVIALPLWISLWLFLLLWLHSYGILHDYYGRFFWFDKLTHTMATGLIACAIFLLLILLNHFSKTVHIPNLVFPLFMIIFTLGMGISWEVLEFGLDSTINTPMQYSLADTMNDLMMNFIGAFLASSACMIYMLLYDPDRLAEGLGAERLVRRYQNKYGAAPENG